MAQAQLRACAQLAIVSTRTFIALGTASQAPTRHRAHNSYALRWDDQLILFDPGEGAQRQCINAGVAIARATAVCVTHFHGDHCLGLPGVIQRRALDNRSGSHEPVPLPVVYPGAGQVYFDRLRSATEFHDTSEIVPTPVMAEGDVLELRGGLRLTARALDHRTTTFGYRLDEPDAVRFDRAALERAGVQGPDVGRLQAEGRLETERGTVTLDEVSTVRRGQSMAFVMDTRMCDGARELADGVDLLVCESTFLESEAELADRYRHLTALQAGRLAAEAGVRRLALTHFSARYPRSEVFATEAAAVHPDVVALDDLDTVDVPTRS